MIIALGSDHAGLPLKKEIMELLDSMNIQYKDFGTYTADSCDYAKFGQQAANAVISGECEKGILCCGTGIGISLAANKVKGIRAVVCSEPYTARLCRQHNNANIIAFGARVIGPATAEMIVDEFFSATYEGERHQKRLDLIKKIEDGEM